MNPRENQEHDIRRRVFALRGYGISDADTFVDTLHRVLKAKDKLKGTNPTVSVIYDAMLLAIPSAPLLSPDEATYATMYDMLSGIDARQAFSFINAFSYGHEIVVPSAMARKFGEYVSEGTRTVLVPEFEQLGPAILEVINSHPNVMFTLTCKRESKRSLFSMLLKSYANVSVEVADIYKYGFTSERYDLIIAIPVFGGRILVNDQDFISREPSLIALQNLLYHINIDGELAIVLPAKITFGGGSTAELRNYVESNYKIKEISALPAGLFSSYTSIRTYLFVFSTGKTDEVVLKRYGFEAPSGGRTVDGELITSNEQLLFGDEFAELSGWNIDMAFSEEDDDIKAFASSPVKKLELKEVATVFRGKAVTARDERGNIGVINISNITDTGIDYSSLDLISEEERKVAPYALQDGDVLVTSRGTTVKIAVFERQPMTCIPSANINVIRPKEPLNGTYLKLFLESSVGAKMLKSLQRGTVIVNINYRDMSELEVPVPPLETQEEIAREYSTGLAFYKETIKTANDGWERLQAEIESKLY